ncbi:MAG: hypothetical protein GF317_06135 [Candidatus Lokiarchaeota archaeon]|nr:hypothetical protein [Candidatus Lokiarchaeota archaeon]
MKKYDKIRYIDEHPELLGKLGLVIEEKMDGSNGRLTYDGESFWYGTRNVQRKEKNLHNFQDRFLEYFAYIKNKIQQSDKQEKIKEILEEIVLFFELCGKNNMHKIPYDFDMKLVVFDGWDKQEEKYIPTSDERVLFLIRELNLERAIRLDLETYSKAKQWLYNQDPKKVEGVVIKNYNSNKRVKLVHPQNSEVESTIFQKHKGSDYYTESKFLHRYITQNRIEKIMFKKDASQMEDIPVILKTLYKDLVYECIPPFIDTEKPDKLDLEYIRKTSSKIAVPLVREVIQDGGISNETKM